MLRNPSRQLIVFRQGTRFQEHQWRVVSERTRNFVDRVFLKFNPSDAWNVVSGNSRFSRFLLLRAFSNRCSNTHIVCPGHCSICPTNLYIRITLVLYSYPCVRLSASQKISFVGSFIIIQGDHVFTGISRSLSIYYGVKTGLLSFEASDILITVFSDQDSYSARRERRRPRGMQNMPRSGRDMQVTVTKTIEFDVELRMGGGHLAMPSRMVDEDYDFYSPEEEQIRTLELQMKQDLEI